MPRVRPGRLTARQAQTAKPGAHGDGGGLWLIVRESSRSWEFRFRSPVTGRDRAMGLGPTYDVGLAAAREAAQKARELIRSGGDPLEDRHRERAQARREVVRTFESVADRYIDLQAPGWRDQRRPEIWRSSLRMYVYESFGRAPVAAITTDDVISALSPVWQTVPTTASRIQGRIERILDYARAQGWREGENPARWKGHLSAIFAPPTKISKVKHRAAIDHKDIARAMAALAASQGLAAKVVRFVALTAARSNEARSATWAEIDLNARVWTIPASRAKTGKEHRVPLSEGAVAILQEVRPLRDEKQGDLVFPGQRAGKPLSDVAVSKALHIAAGTKDVTVHGLRSTFRDWASEETGYPREAAEMALAHVVGGVEGAYRRGDLFEKRREMMGAWAQWCATGGRGEGQ
ncbi:tyrosine-type recombinase/integrase [Acetobacter sacchari]|uniref:Tyrosine-type recombinase/integrase n=1 Tax=Acetobacter sacchari TaxID=2661687 RepID=A0ABS3LZT5_9PROT|nr:site-specific integrase [Acetobacter sacchari]MBO1361434.1 tyrosine-type recombinase/integrase [Acetobacter sacchari]